jgi:Amt family ammonium transporter
MMVIMMKIGFVLLETGSVREKNTSNILLKNCIDSFTGVLVFYFIGYGLMTQQDGGLIGQGKFFGKGFKMDDILNFLF